MPNKTDLSVSPYFDDHDDSKNFHRILFKPTNAVQVRELNQLQTILQRQIERFGDNIFKRGTVIEGCGVKYHSVFPYVKILDLQTDGAPVSVSSYETYYVKNSNNLIGYIVTSAEGFESRSPNLNTLFVKYINSSDDSNTSTFAADQVLTVYNPDQVVERVVVNDGSLGFSNTDSVVILSSLAVTNTSGGTGGYTYSSGDYITQGSANALIVTANTTVNTSVIALRIKPNASDLNVANTVKWSFSNTGSANVYYANGTVKLAINIEDKIGSGAVASIVTDNLGQIESVNVTVEGEGYYYLPTVTIASTSANTTQINSANLEPLDYLTNITVAGVATSPIGTGYAITVSEGIIYQKGFFVRVDEQLAVVSNYSNTQTAAVGFDTSESIINSNIDTSLLDNAIGTENYTAPGADRLKLTPTIVTLTPEEAEANTDFLPIVEFSSGAPYRQYNFTQYNQINDELARRTYEESGDYVLDQFISAVKSPTSFALEDTNFNVIVDPGVAYIRGNRVETVQVYTANIAKGTDTVTVDSTVSINFGNFIKVDELHGVFNFSTAGLIKLYDTAAGAITNGDGSAPAAAGTQIGTARIRSLVHESGTQGTPAATYRLYLFDIQMNQGKNFKNVRSLTYEEASVVIGVADIAGSGDAVIYDANESSMVFPTGTLANKIINSLVYTYKNVKDDAEILGGAANGSITISKGSDSWPYSATLSTTQKQTITVIPEANVTATSALGGSGTVTSTSGNTTLLGSGTNFLSTVQPGDWIKAGTFVGQANSIINNTTLTLTAPANASVAANTAYLFFPQYVPIPLTHTNRSAVISGNDLVIDLGVPVSSTVGATVLYNIRKTLNSAGFTSKTVNRNRYVRIDASNNASSNVGPWSVGVSDVIRLRGVYKGPGSNNTFTANSAGVTNVTNDFYIDHNQNENFYNVGYLYRKDTAQTAFSTSDNLLVEFDVLTGASGARAINSYTVDDANTLATSTSSMNTAEIPEFFDTRGKHYDLRDCLDFRPVGNSTITFADTANTTAAPINPPVETAASRFDTSNKAFPLPDSEITLNLEYYVGRSDLLVVNRSGQIKVITGTPGIYDSPPTPDDAMVINRLIIPPYPSYPIALSDDMIELLDTRVANELYTNRRMSIYKIEMPVNKTQRDRIQQRRYTMKDIGGLEKRIESLEYYVSYTLAELAVRDRVIPSTANPNLNRFKFGFFVDPFDDLSFADTSNPRFNCVIDGGLLNPSGNTFNLEFTATNLSANTTQTGTLIMPAYSEYSIVKQLNGTSGNTSITPTPNPTTYTYDGTMTITPPRFSISSTVIPSNAFGVFIRPELLPILSGAPTTATGPTGTDHQGQFVVDSQAFRIVATGLRPNTRHDLYFSDQLQTQVAPDGGVIGSPLVSDSNGNLSLTFYYDAGLNETDFQSALRRYNTLLGRKQVYLIKSGELNTNGFTSRAEGTIDITGAIANTGTTPAPAPSSSPSTSDGVLTGTGRWALSRRASW